MNARKQELLGASWKLAVSRSKDLCSNEKKCWSASKKKVDYKTDGFSVAEVMGKGVEKDRPSGAKRVDSD